MTATIDNLEALSTDALLAELLRLRVEPMTFEPERVTVRRRPQRTRTARPPRPAADCTDAEWRQYRQAEHAWRRSNER